MFFLSNFFDYIKYEQFDNLAKKLKVTKLFKDIVCIFFQYLVTKKYLAEVISDLDYADDITLIGHAIYYDLYFDYIIEVINFKLTFEKT